MITDTTFFTNEPGYALLDRFKKTLKHVQYFDVLVGYFRTSGFHQLCESFESIDKIRILVGLNVDRKTYERENWKLNVIHDLPTKNFPFKKG